MKKEIKNTKGLRTWVEIDVRALEKNFHALERFLGKKMLLMGVVKSNAYGHGLIPVACALESLGADWLGVDSVVEALRLRRERIRLPILVLGYTLPEHFAKASKENISLTVSSFAAFDAARKWIEKNEKPLRVHLKIDTGMHRQGFLPGEIPALAVILQKNYSHVLENMRIRKMENKRYSNILQNTRISVEGVYSHLADANPKEPSGTLAQMKSFDSCVAALGTIPDKPLLHISASGGALCFPQSFGMVRIGAALYGLWPSPEARECAGKKITLSPVLSWLTIISETKKIKKGERIGYGFTEKLSRASVIAICPVGYWHGYPRMLSSQGEVLARGARAKVLGLVSMDMIAIDVTNIPAVREGDVVTLIGKDGKEEMSAEEVATRAGTTHYEIVTRINPLIRRVLLNK